MNTKEPAKIVMSDDGGKRNQKSIPVLEGEGPKILWVLQDYGDHEKAKLVSYVKMESLPEPVRKPIADLIKKS